MSDVRNTIIIGSGPAGYSAAVYLARARLSPLVLAGEAWGGQLMLTTDVENYPGFIEGIMGPELMNRMRGQAKRFGSEILDRDVSKVDLSTQPFRVQIGEGSLAQEYRAKTILITTGARARMLELGEERLLGRGVSTCAVCDAAFFKDKVTFVVGGGDAAMEEVLALTKHTREVTLIHRRDKLRASQIMQQRVLEENKDKVSVLWNTEVLEIKGDEKLEAIVVEDLKTKKRSTLPADGLFLAIGHLPVTDLFKGKLELDNKGYLMTGLNGLLHAPHASQKSQSKTRGSNARIDEGLWLEGYPTMTSAQGVFGAGDVVDFRYRQAVTAAGFGCMAALDVERYLTGSSQSW
jgi:thioredoxin reductase (NADPH)